MSNVPETVILDMQTRARERKEQVALLKKKVEEKEAERLAVLKELDFAVKSLEEVASFLQEHNSEVHGRGSSWYKELGLTGP